MAKRTCTTNDCTNPHFGRGWCKRHYGQAWRDGTLESQPRTLAKPTDSLDTRLRNIGWTVTESGCWEWNGSKDVYGYGQVAVNRGRPFGAYRIAYEAWVKIPEPGVDICHTCDNPPCINPAHLFEGSRLDNVMDMVNKRRNAHGERQKHKLTDAQVADIRSEYSAGGVKQTEIAAKYGVSQAQVSHVVNFVRRARETTHLP